MNRRLITTFAATVAACLLTVLGLAAPAVAVTQEQRLAVLSSWTQTSASSYGAWNSARQNQSGWADYAFDWSTDLCSASPDNPLGFDFRLSCHRHDFGYRNYKQVGQFPANKARLDDAFYADLKRKCATYASYVRPACYSLAWVYYQAVKQFAAVIITADQLAAAAELRAAGVAQANR
jgi:Prokaryotic phospholipase A2